VRGFWALELSQPARDELVRVQDELRQRLPGRALRWTSVDKLHVTLKFLGEVADPQGVARAVQVLPPPGALSLELGALGSFGGRSPRVLWSGLAGPDREALAGLHADLEAALEPLGFARDGRPYRPHVTLARAGRGRGPRAAGS